MDDRIVSGILFGVIILSILCLIAGSRGGQGEESWFEPFLPPSDIWEYGVVHATEIAGESSGVIIPDTDVAWLLIGSRATEITSAYGKTLTTHKTEIAEWMGGKFRLTQYSPSDWLRGCIRVTRDVSMLSLFAQAPEKGQTSVSKLDICYGGSGIEFVRYTEQWGLSKDNPLALGGVAYWYGEELENLQAEKWWRWGFWEEKSATLQHQDIIDALDWWGGNNAPPPTAMVADLDAPPMELIGRQPGARILGSRAGKIDLEYRNLWGCQPNVSYFGKGALTRVVVVSDNNTYTIWVVSSRLSPNCTTWYLFFKGDVPLPDVPPEEALSYGMDMSPFLRIYSTGGGILITKRGQTSEGESVTVKVGEAASVYYAIAAPANIEDLREALYAIDIMGPAAQKAIGWGFMESVGAGNGLRYFLSTALVKHLGAAPEPSLEFSPALIDQPGIMYWPPR